MINWPQNGRFLSKDPVQDFTELSGTLLNRGPMPALIMAVKFLKEIREPLSRAIALPAGYSPLRQEK